MRRKNVSFKECPDAAPRATLIVAAGRAQHGRAYRERGARGGWTQSHPTDMDLHMKTTLNIDDVVMAKLRHEAARQGRTMSDLVETALRNLFQSQKKRVELSPLPRFNSGGAFVDIADRDALYQAMEGR